MRSKAIFIGITCMLLTSMCNTPVQPPERKSNIPKEARWYGGKDGGVWIIINASDTLNFFHIVVYNEGDGSLINAGLYKVSKDCAHATLTVEEVKNLINGFDGEKVILQRIGQGTYCSLVPVETHK